MAFDLERFVRAQDKVWDQVQRELAFARKRTHWMWFVFPQLRGLGHSASAQFYGIVSEAEARAYLGHPVLAVRLVACTTLVRRSAGRSANDIFGAPDDLKFQSSMTLFASLRGAPPIFADALETFFAGEPDPRTLELLALGADVNKTAEPEPGRARLH